MYADENVIKIKHDVLYEVAKLAFAGELEEKKDYIANQLIPGPTAQFRCCIYKEREIIRQRVRLAEGKAPGPVDDGNVIQVISSACEDCPISSYTVTENCQNCLGKACINACKFGAIEPGRLRSHIDLSKMCNRIGSRCGAYITPLDISYNNKVLLLCIFNSTIKRSKTRNSELLIHGNLWLHGRDDIVCLINYLLVKLPDSLRSSL